MTLARYLNLYLYDPIAPRSGGGIRREVDRSADLQ
jgi:hypothetical protein